MIKCFNWDSEKYECKVFKNTKCSDTCSGRITDPEKYLDRINAMILYNDSNNVLAELRRERELLLAEYPQLIPRADDWIKCYMADKHRGSGGGSSEQDSNNKTSEKQKMKDNRSQSCKLTRSQREEVKKATEEFEEAHGVKFEKLSKFSFGKSKVDTYTGEPIK